jgi:peroxiredoxin Q/BCP
MNQEPTIINQTVPDFFINATDNISGKLSQWSGRPIVLFFYPKDNTPVCSAQAKYFRDHFGQFENLNTQVFGVSRDTLASHTRFKERLGLPYELIADPAGELCNYFEVLGTKNFFGKKITGIIRSTFLIDKNRMLRVAWRKVKVSHHIEEVLNAIREL